MTKIIGGLFGLLLVAAIAAFLLFDINDWKGWIEERASAAIGRQVSIDGPMSIAWSWTPTLTIEDLRIANADWAEAAHLAEVGRLEVSVRLLEQLQGRTVLPEIRVSEPELHLQQRQDGAATWSFGQRSDGETDGEADTGEPDRTGFPVIERLVIEEGRYVFLHEGRGIDLEGSVQTVAGEGGDGDEVDLRGKGKLEGEALEVELAAGSLTRLRDADLPYPVDLEITLGETAAAAEGTLTRPFDLAGVDLSLAIEGPNLADVFPLTGVPLPPTPAYRLAGDLASDGDLWRFTDVDGRLGGSDLRGQFTVDTAQDPLRFEADLTTDKLDFGDLAGFVGAPTEERARDRDDGDRVIPDQAIDLDRLQAANGKARLRARQILAPGLPIDDLVAELTLEDGVLTLEPADFGVAEGTVNLWISLYGAQDPAQIDMLTQVRDLRLKEMFKGSDYAEKTGGKIDGRIELSGRGNSLREMLAGADGTSNLVMSDGNISAMLLELAGLDAMEALGLYFGSSDDDARVPIRCLATDLVIEGGVARTELAVLDTQDTLIEADGTADLGGETLDLVVTPHPKDISLLNLRSKVHVEGPFLDPAISLDAGSILKFVPPIDWGLAESAPCAELIERARENS